MADINLDASRLVDAFMELTVPNPTSFSALIVGTVQDIPVDRGGTEGWLIVTENNMRLTETFLIFSPWVQNMTISIPTVEIVGHLHTIDTQTTSSALSGEYAHTHTVPAHNTNIALPQITIYYDLQIGDRVAMLQLNNSQQFLVLFKQPPVEGG